MFWLLILAGGTIALAFFLLMDIATVPAREREQLDPPGRGVRQTPSDLEHERAATTGRSRTARSSP